MQAYCSIWENGKSVYKSKMREMHRNHIKKPISAYSATCKFKKMHAKKVEAAKGWSEKYLLCICHWMHCVHVNNVQSLILHDFARWKWILPSSTGYVVYDYLCWHEKYSLRLSEKLTRTISASSRGFKDFLYHINKSKRSETQIIKLKAAKRRIKTVKKTDIEIVPLITMLVVLSFPIFSRHLSSN